MFATCSTTLFLVPRHPDFGKNNGKIGLFGGFRVFKNRPILPLVSKIMVKSAFFANGFYHYFRIFVVFPPKSEVSEVAGP